LLPALILLALAGGAGVPAQAGAAPRYGDPLVSIAGLDLQTATIPQLQAAMTVGTITSRQLTQAYLNRIAFFDQGCVKVNAVRALTDDALAQADAADAARRQGRTGILLGIPILLKDNIDTVDADTTAGSIALAGNRPPKDAFLVTQLRAAGAVILGKTNLSEFANWMAYNMPNGYSSLGGQVLNPYDQGDPSGSSSGSGAGGTLAYAAGTFGTETSGSILGPSSADSMVGIKPTVGAVSRSGIIPLAHSYDTAGPIARDVTDAAILLSAVGATDSADSIFEPSSGGPPPDHDYYTGALDPHALQGKRIGYSKDDLDPNLGGLTTEQQVLYQQALTDLQAAGATLVPFDTLFFTSTGGLTELGGIFSEFKYGIADYLAHSAGPAGPGGRPILVSDDLTGIIVYNQQHPSQIPYGQDMLIASDATTGATQDDPSSVATILNAREAIDSAFSQNNLDAYVGPGVNYANIGAAAGYPSVQVPMGYTVNGTNPLGLQILGQAWTERKLIGLAYSYEQATHRRMPPTIADPALLSCKPVAAVAGTTSAPPAARVLPNTSEAPAPAGPMLVLLLPFIAAWGARIRHRARQRARERP
jgi:amidase